MRTALAAAMVGAAMLGADAVPANGILRSSVDVTTAQDISTADSLSSVETAIAPSMSSQFGYAVDVSISGAEGHRRLQAGTSLSISYTILCGSGCAAVADTLSTIASDPTAGVAHAQSIIAAINAAAASSGFGNSVVTSSATDVAATIVAPDTVSITLPPAPPPSPPPTPSPPQADGSGDCTFTFYDEAKSAMAAEDACIEAGGHLASAHSQADADAFESLVGNTAWIGYHDMGFEAGCTDDRHQGLGGEIQATSFVWMDASPSDYENWAAGEPNDWQDGVARCDGTGNEDCTETWNSGANWNDAACDGVKPYICGVCPVHTRNPTSFTFFDEALNKMEAEFNCIIGGGHLASLHSQADQDLVAAMISNTAWIGYHDRFEEAGCTDDRHQGIGGEIAATSFVWTDGTASDYENWAAGEPNDWQDGVARCDGTGN